MLCLGGVQTAARKPDLPRTVRRSTPVTRAHVPCQYGVRGVWHTDGMTSKKEQQQPEEVAVNQQGRVTIPVEMRRWAGLKPGETAYVHVDDQGALVVENRATYTARIRREVAERWTGDPQVSVVDDLAADRRAEAAREDGAA